MVAHVTGYVPHELKCSLGDVHIYKNHIRQCEVQMEKGKSSEVYKLPKLWLNPDVKSIDEFTYNDIKLKGYNSHKKIVAKMAV